MPVRAYVLITTELRKAKSVAEELRTLPSVTMADAVAGAYDVVAVLEVLDTSEIGELVLGRIHELSGVTGTLTLVTVGS
ncbi:MAG: Lrp/AsnC ligand binding domain-containing protein [Chloroflexi bacterium]|nr:Lrp/AsnC ligand binding domain-containing protein [Chloroflexota bacterium]